MFLNQIAKLVIAPTAAGVPSSAVTDVVWSVEPSDAGSVNTTSPDLFAADFTPAKEGAALVVVTAKNADGTELRAQAAINVEAVPVPVVDALNLTIVEVVDAPKS